VRAESSESGSICISVFDSGKGVAGDEIDSIFEPHFTNDETKIKSGLGLSVVQGIVKAHNGDIFVESELGSGSVFHVCLPTVSADQELPTDEDVQPLARNTGSVLVVDDEEANLMMFMKMLKRLGYDVSVCVNGEDALAEMRSFPDRFDLLITDMMMPGMTGLELAEQIQEFKSGFPVVIMTGFAHTFDADSRESGNIKEVMQKPIKMDSLVPVIQRALEQRLQT
jgi:CheY-like chemotaxis protein